MRVHTDGTNHLALLTLSPSSYFVLIARYGEIRHGQEPMQGAELGIMRYCILIAFSSTYLAPVLVSNNSAVSMESSRPPTAGFCGEFFSLSHFLLGIPC